jgi:hypothetical protein
VTYEEQPERFTWNKSLPLVPSETPALTAREISAMTPVDLSLRVFCGYVFEELEYNGTEDVIRVSLRGIAPNSKRFTLNVTAAHHANLIDSTGGLHSMLLMTCMTGYNIILYASKRECSWKVLEKLIELGADVNAVTKIDNPLLIAVRDGNVPLVEYLLAKGFDANL